jgi:hypothetical protein
MRRKIGLLALAAAALFVVLRYGVPAEAQANYLKLLGIRMDGSTGLTIKAEGATTKTAALTGATVNFLPFSVDESLADPTSPPTLGTTFATLGSCRSDTTYHFAIVELNASGMTGISPFLAWTPSSGNANRATVIHPTLSSGAAAWALLISRSSDNPSYSIWRYFTGAQIDALGTNSVVSSCVTNGTIVSVGNTTGAISAGDVLEGRLRAGARAGTDSDDPRITPARKQLSFFGPAPQFDPDNGVDLSIQVLSAQTKLVCARGCEFTTIAAAIAAINAAGDAGASKRYTIQLESEEYNESPFLPDWTVIVGRGPAATRLKGNVTEPAEFHEGGMFNLQTTGNSGIVCAGNSSVRGHLYVMGNVIGSPDYPIPDHTTDPIDSIWNCPNADVYDIGNVHQTVWDQLTASDGARVFSVGSTYRAWSKAGDSTLDVSASAFRVLNGAYLIVEGANVDIRLEDSSADAGYLAGAVWQSPSTQSLYPTILKVLNSHIYLENKSATWNGQAGCLVDLTPGTVQAGTVSGSIVDFSGTVCSINITSTSGALAGFYIGDGTDTDRGTWTYIWRGGSLNLAGGATRRTIDVRTGSLASNTFLLGPTFENPNVFSIVGSATYSFDKLWFNDQDLVANTCSIGEIRTDSAGANRELCWCFNNAGAGRWACVTATTANGPTD